MSKKRFCDKKKSITFRLLHRSQRDPLVADENAPQHVLEPVDTKSERLAYGITFDDDYDYMQHLKKRSNIGDLIFVSQTNRSEEVNSDNKCVVKLPSSVFQSDVEEKIGLLNRAAPKSGLDLSLDPELVASLDDDFDHSDPDNVLEDNFVELADGPIDCDDPRHDICTEDFLFSDDEEEFIDEERDELTSLDNFGKEETKSCFTEYSLSSSVIRRNEQLTSLDDRFEEVIETNNEGEIYLFAEYDDNEIGALDSEDIDGDIDPNTKLFRNYIPEEKSEKIDTPCSNLEQDLTDKILLTEDNEEFSYIEVKGKEKWDCESILSTYSTIYNHPKVIPAPKKIRLNAQGIPVRTDKLTTGALAKLDEAKKNRATGPGSLASAISLLSIRNKNETSDEKKMRKRAFRDYKRERRIERKLNTKAFIEDKKRMDKMNANNKSKFQIPL